MHKKGSMHTAPTPFLFLCYPERLCEQAQNKGGKIAFERKCEALAVFNFVAGDELPCFADPDRRAYSTPSMIDAQTEAG